MAERDGSYDANSGGSPYVSDEKSETIVTPPPVKKSDVKDK